MSFMFLYFYYVSVTKILIQWWGISRAREFSVYFDFHYKDNHSENRMTHFQELKAPGYNAWL